MLGLRRALALPTMTTRRRFRVAGAVDWALLGALLASGVAHPRDPALWYDSLLRTYLAIIVPLLLLAALAHRASLRRGARIQGERRRPPKLRQEIFETSRAMLVVACMAAWPVTQHRLGLPTGLTWSIDQSGGWALTILQMYLGIVAIDAWTYWKHRMLHTRLMFGFHRQHHAFRDPTPFAGFAIGPLEAVLTFWPLLFLLWPKAVHFAPLYFTAIGSFVVLNLYLHCGVTFRWAEWLLPRLLLNSSAWHNVHHADATANFGEVSFIWDRLLGTSREAQAAKRAARGAERAAGAGVSSVEAG